MKVIAISDTHGKNFAEKIPECDVLIMAGDILPDFELGNGWLQKQWFWDSFIPYLNLIPAKYKILIAGNHDFYFQDIFKDQAEDEFKSKLPNNIFYLRDSNIVLDGVKFHGTPWVTHLRNWAFNIPDNKGPEYAKEYYSKIDNDVDVLISHCPPYGYGDTILEYNEMENLGNKWLMDEIKMKNPKYVVFGHIHSGNHNRMKWCHDFCEGRDVHMYNVSMLNEMYEFHYEPLELEIKKEKINDQ